MRIQDEFDALICIIALKYMGEISPRSVENDCKWSFTGHQCATQCLHLALMACFLSLIRLKMKKNIQIELLASVLNRIQELGGIHDLRNITPPPSVAVYRTHAFSRQRSSSFIFKETKEAHFFHLPAHCWTSGDAAAGCPNIACCSKLEDNRNWLQWRVLRRSSHPPASSRFPEDGAPTDSWSATSHPRNRWTNVRSAASPWIRYASCISDHWSKFKVRRRLFRLQSLCASRRGDRSVAPVSLWNGDDGAVCSALEACLRQTIRIVFINIIRELPLFS